MLFVTGCVSLQWKNADRRDDGDFWLIGAGALKALQEFRLENQSYQLHEMLLFEMNELINR